MERSRSFSIHKNKKSLVDRLLTARESLRKSLEETSHRLELAGIVNNVDYVNDARSGDLLSTRDSFKCINKPIIWVAVAPPHERDYALIEKYIRYKIKSIVVYGTNCDDFRKKLEPLVDRLEVGATLDEAIRKAHKLAVDEDVVLYSPSFHTEDDSFVQRGNLFKEIVENLIAAH